MLAVVDDKTLQKVAEAFGGEEAVQIISSLKGIGETTDDEIAAKTEIRLNTVRRILYKLYDYSLVGLRRSRDKNTGWFILSNRKDDFLYKLLPEIAEIKLENNPFAISLANNIGDCCVLI